MRYIYANLAHDNKLRRGDQERRHLAKTNILL